MEEQNTATNGPAPMNVYLYAGDQIVENVTKGYFYYQDSLGNTSHVTDAIGNLLERYTYDAFGTPTFRNAGGSLIGVTSERPNGASALGIKHLFQGQLWTQDTGLNDYRNRVELAVMGVFLQPDPIGFKGDAANIYRFCNNNAVNRSDPMGLFDMWRNLTNFFNGNPSMTMVLAAWNDQVSRGHADSGKLTIESARVVMTDKQSDVHNPDDNRAGWTPDPQGNSFATTRATGENELEVTYHLRVNSYINTARGPKNQAFARKREPDHTNDYKEARDGFTARARTLVGQRFDTRTDAAAAMRSVIDPYVKTIYEYSKRWDIWEHHPRENGRYLTKDE
jgi:RHS repeat-associated protein